MPSTLSKIKLRQSERDVCELEIKGMAFLWHQVRCMASVLFLIGMGHEKPEVIDFLLDVERCPKRPQYGIASDTPLVLYDVGYDDIEWIYETESNDKNISTLQNFWVERNMQAFGLQVMVDSLRSKLPAQQEHVQGVTGVPPNITSLLVGYTNSNCYHCLEERAVCGGLERHLEKQAVKRIKLEQKYAQAAEKK